MANPFSKLSGASSLDPRTIKISEFEKYESVEIKKMNARWSVMRRSVPWLLGMTAAFAVLSWASDAYAKHNLFGVDCKL